jgi:hypothetical protein
LLLKFLRDEKGATAIEYGLIAAGISLANHQHRERHGHQAEHQIHLDQQLAEIAART